MQILTVNKTWLFLSFMVMMNQTMANGPETGDGNEAVCKGRTEAPRQCRWIDGTISIYNGTPSVRIRQRSTRKIYAVGPAEREWIPAELKSKLTVDNGVTGHFKVCPIDKKPQRGLRAFCIDEAKISRIIDHP